MAESAGDSELPPPDTSADSDADTSIEVSIDRLVRDEWPKLVAVLVRELGDLSLAEDAAQDAAEVALQRWHEDGIPDRPGAWITTVARRRAVDRIRRDAVGRRKAEDLARLEARLAFASSSDEPGATESGGVELRDEQLALIFGCCHPALSVEAQVALTLRSIGGLTTAEIARGFVVPEPTMAQRLVRAKRKIATAAIPFRVPEDSELLGRVEVVHRVLYLIFNEGYSTSTGDDLQRFDLTAEAIRLSRLLAELLHDDAETLGQLALFLFIDARRAARSTSEGDLVLLGEQDRTLWDGRLIAEAGQLLARAMALGSPGPFQIEAAINALHAEAASESETDWAQIAALYGALRRHRPTSVVTLNQAVATALACGPELGLDMLDEPSLASELDRYHYYHSARADLLRRSGDTGRAITAYRRAIELVGNEPERRFLQSRIDGLAEG